MAKKRSPTEDRQKPAPAPAPSETARKRSKAEALPPADPSAPQASPATASPARLKRKPASAARPEGAAEGTDIPAKPKAPRPPAARPAARKAAPAPEKPAGRTRTAEARPSGDGPLHIAMVASEARPFATTGGLAEVMGSLPQALARLGHAVTVILPKYRETDDRAGDEVVLALGDRRRAVRFVERPIAPRVTAVLVDAPDLFQRDGLYGTSHGDYADNALRFAVLSRGAIEYLRRRGERPSVIHAHDWQAGLVPAYQKMFFSDDPIVGGVPAVFTIHNLAFQGLFPASTLPDIGLPWDVFDVQAMEFWGQISFLKAGINFSERLTTVSPRYAKEILTPEMGFGFDGVLRRRSRSLVGILNGIDTDRWNPSADEFLPAPYTADDLSGKAEARQSLLQAVGLPHEGHAAARPLIGLVSRLTDQKGFDLIGAGLDELMSLDATWVMLGSGERRYEEQWTALARRYPERVSTTIGFSDRLEHLIEAGADAFLMPSRFEPCGLNQLNSLRYGTLPIVRATGGLDDTVRDAGTSAATGFKFAEYTPAALVGAVRRALTAYGKPEQWRKMQQAAMREDHSWDVSAREYVKVYSANS